MPILHQLFIIFLIVLTLPLQIISALGILIFSGPPVLFRQKRVGKNGHNFTLFKLRTMKLGAESELPKLKSLNEASGPTFKVRNDPRFTSIGKFLSHTGLDELPQLYNVLIGDMSLFGPRPLPVYEAAQLTKWQQARHNIKPGIMSPWILNGYHSQPFSSWMKSDIEYSHQKNLLYDTQLFFKSLLFVFQILINEIPNFVKPETNLTSAFKNEKIKT